MGGWLQKYVDEINFHSGGQYRVEIKDNTLSIPPRKKHKIFMPTLVIRDVERANKLLDDYFAAIKSRQDVPFCQMDKDHGETYFFHMLLKNSSYADILNFEEHIHERTDMILDDTFEAFEEPRLRRIVDGLAVFARCAQSERGFETPRHMQFFFADGKEIREIPLVRYGIYTDSDGEKEAVIYAIQNQPCAGEAFESLKATVLSHPRASQFQGDVDQDVPELIKKMNAHNNVFRQATPSMVLSLALFAQMLKWKGIYKVKAPSYLPKRHNEIAKRLKGTPEEREAQEARIQNAATFKFIQLFLRLDSCLSGFKKSVYPGSSDGFIHIELSDEFECTNGTLAKLLGVPVVKKEDRDLMKHSVVKGKQLPAMK